MQGSRWGGDKGGVYNNAMFLSSGTIDTPSLNDRMKALGDYDTVSRDRRTTPSILKLSFQAREKFIARQKMGRLGNAEEVASMFVYLASDEVMMMLHSIINVTTCIIIISL